MVSVNSDSIQLDDCAPLFYLEFDFRSIILDFIQVYEILHTCWYTPGMSRHLKGVF